MQELDTKHSREEADVESNSGKLGASTTKDDILLASSPLNIDDDSITLVIAKDSECRAVGTLVSNTSGEHISTIEENEREDEARLSSSLRMFVSKDGSDEEDPGVSMNRSSPSEEGEKEVIAMDDMTRATCGRKCKGSCKTKLKMLYTILYCILGSFAVAGAMYLPIGWVLLACVIIIVLIMILPEPAW